MASDEQIALVVAPAGFGKTTLISGWLQERPFSSAWVTFDPSDDEPAVFWTYILETLHERCPEVGLRSLRELRSGGAFDWKRFVPLALHELEALRDELVLVLDDMQVIVTPACLDGLGRFLQHLPPHLRVVLLSRTAPALPLARFRARGQVTELRMEDLRFTAEETRQMLNVEEGLCLPENDVALLHARTEGWPAALYLAARAIRSAPPESRSVFRVLSSPDAHLLDYVNSEVLGDLDLATRRFLLETSVVNSLTHSLANSLTGRNDSQALLEGLSRTNRLVTALDGRSDWYRYHPLLRDSLESERRRLGDDSASLHLRAAEWFESEGLVFPAVDHALHAGRAEIAAELIARHRVALVGTGLAAPIKKWLDQLPDDLGVTAEGLSLLALACLLALDSDSPSFDRWERLAREAADATGKFAGIHQDQAPLSLFRCVRTGVVGRSARACAATAAALIRDAEPGTPWWLYGQAQLAVALYLQEGATPRGLAAARVALESASPNPYPISDIQALSVLALHALDSGDGATARLLSAEALELVASANRDTSPQAAMAHIALGRCLALEGNADQAEREIHLALSLRQADRSRLWFIHGLLALAEVRSLAGERAGVASALEEARRLLPRLEDAGVLPSLLDRLDGRDQALKMPLSLTEAELRVLRLLGGSASLREVGRELYISRNTVKTHTRSVYRKLGVGSRAAAVAAARERGWLR